MPQAEDESFMRRALDLAQEAGQAGEVPVGAVVVLDGKIIGEGQNQPITQCDPTAHAEVVALRAASLQVGNYRLPGATLYVSIEPCTMCAGALMHSRIQRLVFGAAEPKSGCIQSQLQLLSQPYWNHTVAVTAGVLEGEARALIQAFFKARRK